MRIAIFISYENLESLDRDIMQAFLFNIENNLITSIGHEIINVKNINYLSLWLISKNINVLYVENMNQDTVQYLERIGISVKSIDEIKNHPLLKSFLL